MDHIKSIEQYIKDAKAWKHDDMENFLFSGIGYLVIVHALYWSIEIIAFALSFTGWTFHEVISLSDWRSTIVNGTTLALMGARYFLRCRKHIPCALKYLASVLRWLHPLSPKPFEVCTYCQTAAHGKTASGNGHQHQHEHQHEYSRLASAVHTPPIQSDINTTQSAN